jgi:alpha-glucosidase (family GH31 glycosyl hydrolase)
MERELDFTYDEINFGGLPQYISELKESGIKFIPIVDPGIKYNETEEYETLSLGNEMDVWIKRPDGTPMIGAVWPGRVYFPDFSRNSTREWWTYLLTKFKSLIDYDGIWIDMNEPANWGVGDMEEGCANNSLNFPPYVPAIRDGNLAGQTICPDAQQDYGVHYDTHSLYGWSESEATLL